MTPNRTRRQCARIAGSAQESLRQIDAEHVAAAVVEKLRPVTPPASRVEEESRRGIAPASDQFSVRLRCLLDVAEAL